MRARCGWQAAEAGSRRGLGLSSAVRYALPGTGRCQLCPGQDGGYRDVGTLQSPPPYPAGLGRGTVQAHCSCSSLQEGSRGAFQDTRCAVVPGYCCVFFFFLAFTHRSWQFPTHSRNQDGPAQGQRRCSNTISIPLTASLTPCPAETQDTTCTDQMDLSSSSTPSPKPSSILHRVTPVPRSDPFCKYQSHQSRQSTAAESLGERHCRDSSQHGELSPRCSTLPAHTLCPGCHTEPLSPSY